MRKSLQGEETSVGWTYFSLVFGSQHWTNTLKKPWSILAGNFHYRNYHLMSNFPLHKKVFEAQKSHHLFEKQISSSAMCILQVRLTGFIWYWIYLLTSFYIFQWSLTSIWNNYFLLLLHFLFCFVSYMGIQPRNFKKFLSKVMLSILTHKLSKCSELV